MAKVSKDSADYRRHEGGGKTCCSCVHMKMDGSCELVKGQVECDHTCSLWEAVKHNAPGR